MNPTVDMAELQGRFDRLEEQWRPWWQKREEEWLDGRLVVKRWRISARSFEWRSHFVKAMARRLQRRFEKLGPGTHELRLRQVGPFFGTALLVAREIVLEREPEVAGFTERAVLREYQGDDKGRKMVFADGKLMIPSTPDQENTLKELVWQIRFGGC